MKRIFLALAAVAAFLAFPTAAAAQDNSAFVGPRVELNAGFDDLQGVPDITDLTYGAAVGVDVPVGDKVTLGIDGTATNVFDRDRILGVGARVGYAVSPEVLLFARAGYENYRLAKNFDLEGLSLGGGVEFGVTQNTFVKFEGRYSDFDNHTGRLGALAAVGLRF